MRSVVAALLAVLAVPAAAADQRIQLEPITPYADRTVAPEAVQAECELDTLIPQKVRAQTEGIVQLVERTNQDPAGRILTMRIVEVIAQPGGKYSGPKSVRLEGELRDNGVIVASFATRRERDSFINWRPTCSIVRVAAEDTAEDVARWLRAPRMNALLGLAKEFLRPPVAAAPAPPPPAPAPPPPIVTEPAMDPVAVAPVPGPAAQAPAKKASRFRSAVARQTVNLRSRPSRGGAVVGAVKAGAQLKLDTQLENGDGVWWWVVNVGKGGWIRDADVQIK